MNEPKKQNKIKKKRYVVSFIFILFAALLFQYFFAPVYGAELGSRSLQLSDDQISVHANYLVSFTTATAGLLGSITIQFCSNDAIIGDPCTAPAGFDASSAELNTQTGITGFTINAASTANELILSRSSVLTPVTHATYLFTGVQNPSSSGSYYARVQTYASNDATGIASDYGSMAFAILNSVALNATVPPYLIFCTGVTISGLNCANATGDYIDFGELTNTHTATGTSQMLAATNANNGYAVTVFGTTMTSGNNVINGLSNNDVSRPGVSQFGLNLRANTTPPSGTDPMGPGTGQPTAGYDQQNSFRFNSGDTILSNSGPENYREYTASYMVNVSSTQAPGIYVTTLTYIALATF